MKASHRGVEMRGNSRARLACALLVVCGLIVGGPVPSAFATEPDAPAEIDATAGADQGSPESTDPGAGADDTAGSAAGDGQTPESSEPQPAPTAEPSTAPAGEPAPSDPTSPDETVGPAASDGGLVVDAASRPGAVTVRAVVLSQTNQVRKDNGRAALASSAALDAVAQRWSEQQARASKMSHNPRLGSEVPAGWKRLGENVAAGFSYQSVVQGWRNSPGHFGNIIGDYTHIGIGVGYDSLGRPYYTQVFGKYPSGISGDRVVSAPSDGPFIDVRKNDKFATEIAWMLETGLSTGIGTSAGRAYDPKGTVSREAMAAFLYRLSTPKGAKAPAGYTAPKTSPFADVPVSHKFYKEIAWMYTSGLSTGIKRASGKPKYAPKDGVSREAMAAFMFRLENPSSNGTPGTSPFADVPRSHQFFKQIAWMHASGLSTGVKQSSGKPKYLPKDRVSREAMAAFLYRAKA